MSLNRAQRARRTFEVLSAGPDVFETFFEQARVGLALADLSGQFVRVNQAYADLLGRAPEDLIGQPVAALVHPEDQGAAGERLDAVVQGRLPALQFEERTLTPYGEALWVLHGVSAVPGSDGRPAWLALSAQDITERRQVENDLRALTASLTEAAVRDPLTGLANRTLLEERLRAVLAKDVRSGQSTAVLFLDLDGFKNVNDEHGHATGDQVLRAVARRIAAAVRPSDTVARLGGDEFVVLVEGADQRTVDLLVERLHDVVSRPIGTLGLYVGVSIGVAFSNKGEQPPTRLLGEA
ncbi:MAG: sensor domain-containing diguanylate cyclase, partial [Mycobacteriales bacterium]